MSVLLYRDGGTHTVRGVSCEMGKFPNQDLRLMLSQGWRLTPEPEAPPEPEVTQESEAPPEPEPDVEPDADLDGKVSVDLDALTDDELRRIARMSGIKSWHNKKIETIKKELDALDDT